MEIVNEASKRSKEFANEVSKKSKEFTVEALKRADQLTYQIPPAATVLTNLVDSTQKGNEAADLDKYGITDDLRNFIKGITISRISRSKKTEKFRTHFAMKLSKKEDMFGDSVDEVFGICTQIVTS